VTRQPAADREGGVKTLGQPIPRLLNYRVSVHSAVLSRIVRHLWLLLVTGAYTKWHVKRVNGCHLS